MTEHRRRLAELLAGAEDPPRPSDEIGKLAGILSQRDDNRRNRADYHASRQSGPEYGDIWDAMHPMDKAALATAPVPGVGDIVGLAADARALYEEPSWTNAGIMALGAVPLVPAAGVLKRGADAADNAIAAHDVARLLREGKAADVTDDLIARADPAELHDLYVSGATGADMPMDEASRMARANEAGFDTDKTWYHGTGADFAQFSLDKSKHPERGVWFGRDETASRFAKTRGEGANVLPTYIRSDEPYIYDATNPNRPASLLDIFSDMTPHHTGVSFVNGDDVAQTINSPENARSRFARFDPRLKHLRNLNAGIAGAVALPLSARLMMDREQDE